jgi:hypothetical protein
MRTLKINLENKPMIIIEYNKSVLEFSNINELKKSKFLNKTKFNRLIAEINTALESDLSDFKFNL